MNANSYVTLVVTRADGSLKEWRVSRAFLEMACAYAAWGSAQRSADEEMQEAVGGAALRMWSLAAESKDLATIEVQASVVGAVALVLLGRKRITLHRCSTCPNERRWLEVPIPRPSGGFSDVYLHFHAAGPIVAEDSTPLEIENSPILPPEKWIEDVAKDYDDLECNPFTFLVPMCPKCASSALSALEEARSQFGLASQLMGWVEGDHDADEERDDDEPPQARKRGRTRRSPKSSKLNISFTRWREAERAEDIARWVAKRAAEKSGCPRCARS